LIQDILNVELKRYGIKVKLIMFDQEEELNQAYNDKKLDGLFGDPVMVLNHYDTLNKHSFINTHFGFAPEKSRLFVVVKKQAKIHSLAQLKGKRAAFYSSNRIEKVFLETLLLRQKLPELKHFFKESYEVKSGNLALLDVFFGKADVTIVPEYLFNTAAELNPQLGKQLAILDRSPLMLARIVGLRRSPLSEAAVQSLLKTSKASFKVEGDENLKYLKLKLIQDEELQPIMEMIAEHQTLINDRKK